GLKGNEGQNGTIRIVVDGKESYSSRYDIAISSMMLKSDDNVIEPGELLTIKELCFENTGKMPTPSTQPIQISVIPNEWIDFDAKNKSTIPISIAPEQIAMISPSLQFKIKETKNIPAVDSKFIA